MTRENEALGRVARLQGTAKSRAEEATAWATKLRHRSSIADAAFLIYERDRMAAGTVLGSAIAFRLFLFFVPCVLFGVGFLGVFSGSIDPESITDSASLSGALATQVRSALSQSATAAYFSLLTGLFLMISGGRSLAKALVASSSLAWLSGGKVTARVKAIVAVVGVVMSLILMSMIINRIRDELGIAVAGLSFGVGVLIYLALTMLLMSTLPRGTTDPGALLPGAVVVSVVIAGMQAISQLYLPGQFSNASDLYGGVGVAIVTLGWLFIVGRTFAFSFSVNAALFDRFGSLSQPVFSLPVLRHLPQRSQGFRNYFGLDAEGKSLPADRVGSSDDLTDAVDSDVLTAVESLSAIDEHGAPHSEGG